MATSTNNNENNPFASFKLPNIDLNCCMDSYKKNLEILGLINKMSMEVCKGIVKLQAAFVQQSIADAGSVLEKCNKPSEAVAKMSEVTRDNIVKAITNGKQIVDLLTQTNNELTSAVTHRFKESIEEAKAFMNKPSAPSK